MALKQRKRRRRGKGPVCLRWDCTAGEMWPRRLSASKPLPVAVVLLNRDSMARSLLLKGEFSPAASNLVGRGRPGGDFALLPEMRVQKPPSSGSGHGAEGAAALARWAQARALRPQRREGRPRRRMSTPAAVTGGAAPAVHEPSGRSPQRWEQRLED